MGVDPDNSGLHARQNAGIFKVRGPADVMPDAAPGGAAGVWPGRFSGRVMEKEIWKSGVRDANTSHVTSPASLVRRCFTSGQHTIAGLVRGSPARVYAGDSCRSSRDNDARRFSIWHHLDAHGIPFKSITPKNDTLLITFDSSDQSAAAKAVLDRTLPHGYIIAQQDNNSQAMQWLTRLRDNSHRFG